MTLPCPETIASEKGKLYVTDAELIRRLGVPQRSARLIIGELEAKHGFPKKQPLWGGRRYWPAVEAWLDKLEGLTVGAPLQKERRHG